MPKDTLIRIVAKMRLYSPVLFEAEIVKKISDELSMAGVEYSCEVKIGKRSRLDLLLDGGIAVEFKKGKQNRKLLMSQLDRYARNDLVNEIVLISERGIIGVPNEIHGKKITYLSLFRNWM